MAEVLSQHSWVFERQVPGDIEAFLRLDRTDFELLCPSNLVGSIVVILGLISLVDVCSAEKLKMRFYPCQASASLQGEERRIWLPESLLLELAGNGMADNLEETIFLSGTANMLGTLLDFGGFAREESTEVDDRGSFVGRHLKSVQTKCPQRLGYVRAMQRLPQYRALWVVTSKMYGKFYTVQYTLDA